MTYQNFPEGQGVSRPIYAPDEHYVYMIAPGIDESGTWNNWYDADHANYVGGGQTLPDLPISGVVEVIPEPSSVVILIMAVGLVLRHLKQ